MQAMKSGQSLGRRLLRSLFVSAALAASSLGYALETQRGDFQTILGTASGELVVWQYAHNPNLYIFDFPSLTQQGRTFNRVTQLTEQFTEAYPRVLSMEELDARLAAMRRTTANMAFGHDVLVSELTTFFNLAARDHLELFPEEEVLRDFLLQQGLMQGWRDFYRALKPDAVVLSVPQIQARKPGEPAVSEGARAAILTHEFSHGEYYTNPYYAEYCKKFWSNALSEPQREAFRQFLSRYNYDPNQGELLVNEMQAYLMFTPDAASFNAARLGVSDAELAAMRDAFRRGRPPTKLPMM